MELNQVIVNGQLYSGESTLQDYLDNGWKLESSYDAAGEIQARRNNTVYGNSVMLYNGEHMVCAYAYNLTEEACALAECSVTGISVNVDYGESCISVANGLNIGSTYDEVIAALGEPLSTTDLGDGTTRLNYNRAIMDTYTWEVVVDEATQQVIDLHIGL